MPLPADFKFSDIPAAQAEGERRAVLIFGADWRDACNCEVFRYAADGIDEFSLVLSSKKLSWHDVNQGGGVWFTAAEGVSWTDKLVPNDLADGSPAKLRYNCDGHISTAEYYRDGMQHDSEDGLPAVVHFYPNGQVRIVEHFLCGHFCDAEDGTPGLIYYAEDGAVSRGASAVNGKLTAEEVNKLLAAAKINRVAALLEKADKSVIPVGMPLPKKVP